MAKEKRLPVPTIDDVEFWGLEQTRKAFEELVLCLTKKTDPRIKVSFYGVPYSPACTDHETIWADAYRFVTTPGMSRERQFRIIYGLIVHEVAHILYSDAGLLKEINQGYTKSRGFSKVLDKVIGKDREDERFLRTGGFRKMLAVMLNIIEDGYIENVVRSEYPGLPALYLEETRDFFAKDYKSVAEYEALNPQEGSFNFWCSCAVAYATTGTLDFGPGPETARREKLRHIMPLIDEGVICNSPYGRANIAWRILKLIGLKGLVDDEEKGEGDEDAEELLGGKGPSEKPSGDVKDSRKGKEKAPAPPDTDPEAGKGDSEAAETGGKPDSSDSGKEAGADAKAGAPGDGKGSLEDEGSADEATSADTERLMKGIMEDFRDSLVAEAVKKERKADAELVRGMTLEGGSSKERFRKIPVNVNDWDDWEYGRDEKSRLYEDLMREVKPVSRRLQKSLLNELKDRELGHKQAGLVVGRRFEGKDAHRRDLRVFSNRKAPQELKNMAVAVMVDLSGSMGGQRMESARKTAGLIQDFCESLGYPVAVYGHDAGTEGVNIYTFTEWDGKGKESIGSMKAIWDNQDGTAIRYATKRLTRRPEPHKVLFLLSDGGPCNRAYRPPEGVGINYVGAAAVRDMQQAAKEARRKSVNLICAGIGSDKDTLCAIYGQEQFMDVSDLSKMPTIIAKRLKRLIAEV